MQNFVRKYMIVIIGVVLFLSVGLGAMMFFPQNEREVNRVRTRPQIKSADAAVTTQPQESFSQPQIQERKIYVHVTGAVNKPGFYEMPDNARIFHAIEAAGGFSNIAAQDDLNLAEEIRDGEQIRVLTRSEVSKRDAPAPTPAPGVYVPENSRTRESSSSSSSSSSSMIASRNNFFMMDTTPVSKKSGAKTSSKSKKSASLEQVDINHASIQELQKLKGVGEAIAKRIYEYRQTHGSFKSVDELVNVKGIGAAKLKAMRDQIIIR